MEEELRRRDELFNKCLTMKVTYPLDDDMLQCKMNDLTFSLKNETLNSIVFQGIDHCLSIGDKVIVDINEVYGGDKWKALETAILEAKYPTVTVINGPTDFKLKEQQKAMAKLQLPNSAECHSFFDLSSNKCSRCNKIKACKCSDQAPLFNLGMSVPTNGANWPGPGGLYRNDGKSLFPGGFTGSGGNGTLFS